MEEMQYLRTLEEILVEHRAFGDSDYIHEQVDICYQRRLGKLSAHLPLAAAAMDAVCRADPCHRRLIFSDTVARFTINTALQQSESGTRHSLPIDECEEVFRAILRYLDDCQSGRPAEFGTRQVNRLDFAPFRGRVWSGGHSDEIFGRVFRLVVKERFAQKCQPGAELSEPTADDLAMLTKGTRLLNELVPLLTRSALGHVDLIALFPLGPWNGAASMSQFGLSGTVFLSKDLISNPWWVAEHLLHEALHQKLYDFRHGHSLLEPDFAREDAPRICSLWNVPGSNNANCWDIHRAVAAFHVYVHLALLSAIAEERASELEEIYGPINTGSGMTNSRKAMERAHYLGEKLQAEGEDELGLAGKRLVEWLISVLNALDYSPPPTGAYTHLLLDRYRGEAWTVEKKVESCRLEARSNGCGAEAQQFLDLGRRLTKLAKSEMEITRSVLSTVNAEAELRHFNASVDLYADEELGTHFASVRGLISRSIMSLLQDGYGLRSAAQEMVQRMVEDSSAHLHNILEKQEA
jgi:hypothetical protein